MGDDRILLTLKTPWADGTRHLLFAPMELLEKLASLTPRPRINLILYHGVLGPNARWRARVVAYGAPLGTTATAANLEGDSDDEAASPSLSRHGAWANLMRRAFDVDVLACPRCGGRLRLLGTIDDPVAIRAILDSLAVSARTTRSPATGDHARACRPRDSSLTDRPLADACVGLCAEVRQRTPRSSRERRYPSTIPWLLKPVYGLLSDFVLLFGRRRTGYFVVSSALAALAGFVNGGLMFVSLMILARESFSHCGSRMMAVFAQPA